MAPAHAGVAALVQDPVAISSVRVRYQQLEEASASLRERIRHLDDMVHCQQKKVKQMVEEVSRCQRSRARECFLRQGHFGPRATPDPQLRSLWPHSGLAQITAVLAPREISSYAPRGDYPFKRGPSPD